MNTRVPSNTVSFPDLFPSVNITLPVYNTVVLVPDPNQPQCLLLFFSITHITLSHKSFNCGDRPHHEWCVVSQGKQPQTKPM